VTESQLRKYIRKEILKESNGVYMDVSDLTAIWDSIVDAFEMVKVSFKGILSSTKYMFDVFTAPNLEEIEKAKTNYQARKERIADEYAAAFSKISDNMGADFRAATFIMAPNLYLGTRLVMQGPVYYKATVEYLRDAGIEVKDEMQRYSPDAPRYEKMLARAQEDALMGRTTKQGSNVDFTSLSKRIMQKLNTKTGVGGTTESLSTDLPIIVEAGGEEGKKEKKSYATTAFEGLSKQVMEMDPSEMVDPAGAKAYIDLKAKEAQDYVGMINMPLQFVVEAAKAKDLSQLQAVIKKMQGGAIKIEGLGPEEEKKIVAAAQEIVKSAKAEGKTADVFKAAGMPAPKEEKNQLNEEDPADKQGAVQADSALLQAAQKVAVMNAIKNFALIFQDPRKAGEPGKNYLLQLESVKKKFIEAYTSDVSDEDADVLKKTENGKKLLTTIEKGKKAIESAGLLGAGTTK
jgi:hypothetical protein